MAPLRPGQTSGIEVSWINKLQTNNSRDPIYNETRNCLKENDGIAIVGKNAIRGGPGVHFGNVTGLTFDSRPENQTTSAFELTNSKKQSEQQVVYTFPYPLVIGLLGATILILAIVFWRLNVNWTSSQERQNTSQVDRVPAIREPKVTYPLDLNLATAEELETVRGIGPSTSAKIIEHREKNKFETLDELLDVDGIGPTIFKRIKKFFKIGSQDSVKF